MAENIDNKEKKVVIELDNVRRNFMVGDEVVHALKGVSFKIYEGEFVTIMGKSGSGKSTLLNQLGCLDTPSSGEYYLDGVSVRKMSRNDRAILRNRKIGFIFQNYNLLPKTTSVENVELPLMYNPSVTAEERKQRILTSLSHYYGPEALDPVVYYESDWGSEEWTRGAYAASFDLGGLSRYGKYLRENVGPLHFACSDLAGAGYQHVDGAIRMGRLVASQVIDEVRA